MDGLATLERDGLQLADADECGSIAELLQWHRVAGGDMPDADTTVLLWIMDGQVGDREPGWWDGEHWRLCESGGVAFGVVTHWAEPEGPAC